MNEVYKTKLHPKVQWQRIMHASSQQPARRSKQPTRCQQDVGNKKATREEFCFDLPLVVVAMKIRPAGVVGKVFSSKLSELSTRQQQYMVAPYFFGFS